MRGWLLLALLLIAPGCGPSSYNDFRSQLVGRACTRAVRCGVVGASERARCGVPPALALTTAGPLDVDTAVAASRLSFDSFAASDCLDAMQGAPCDEAAAARHLSRHCHNVIAPHVQTDRPCETDEECMGGRCARDADGCHGTCVAFASPGGPCLPDGGPTPQTCDATVQYCGEDRAGEGFTCHRHKQAGDACAADAECAFALVCRGTCRPLPLAGNGLPCAADTPCGDGLRCLDGTCRALATGGAACSDAGACADGFSCTGFGPQGAGTCKPWRDLELICVLDGDGSGCPASQRCDPATAVCASQPATAAGPHQPCREVPCGDRLYCARASSTCLYRVGQGGACRTDEPDACVEGLLCDPQRLVCVSPVRCG